MTVPPPPNLIQVNDGQLKLNMGIGRILHKIQKDRRTVISDDRLVLNKCVEIQLSVDDWGASP